MVHLENVLTLSYVFPLHFISINYHIHISFFFSDGSLGGAISEMANTPGTVLVIGIIAGAIIAVILIVIIVLKMRTRVEGNFKVEESTRTTYQFQQNSHNLSQQGHNNSGTLNSTQAVAETTPLDPNGDQNNDTGFETPSIVGISTLPGTKATVIPASNGFYEKYVNNNGRKKNGGKAVREWYV